MMFNMRDKKNIIEMLRITFLKDLNIKLICLFLAVVMYVLVSYSQLSEKSFNKKINVTGLRSDLVIANSIPESVRFVVKDKKNIIERISEDDFTVGLDLSESESKGSGKYQVKLTYTFPRIMKSFFSGITISPEIIYVDVENVKEKNVPVHIPVSGYLRSGYVVKERKLNPSEIRVKGPESLLDSLKTIETERIDMSDAADSFERVVKLNYNRQKLKVIGTDEVYVYYMITRKTESKVLKIRTPHFFNADPKLIYRIANQPVSVSVTGTDTVINSMTEKDVRITFDVSNITEPGIHSFPVYDIDVPSDVDVTSVSPKIIELLVEKD